MPDEQDAQDGIVMQLQPFVSLWKILYLMRGVVADLSWGGVIFVIIWCIFHQT